MIERTAKVVVHLITVLYVRAKNRVELIGVGYGKFGMGEACGEAGEQCQGGALKVIG